MLATPGGTDGPPALRRLNVPRPARVRPAADGSPGALLWNGRWLVVSQVLDHYRTDDRWWTEKPVSRSYYELLLDDGRMVTVFHDLIRDRWYEQRYG